MIKQLALHLTILLSIAISPALFGAELIKTPEGARLRVIPSWENIEKLTIQVGDAFFTPDLNQEKVDYLFTHDALCSNANYFIEYKDKTNEQVTLDHLCRTENDKTTFLLVSDTQKKHDYHIASGEFITELFTKYGGFDFVVNGGDIVQEGTPDQWKQYRAIASKYYTKNTPMIPIIGNHDYRQDPQLKIPDLLYGTDHNKAHYSLFDMPNLSLIVLNSNTDVIDDSERTRQYIWLNKILSNLDRSKPVIIVYHHAVDSSGIANIIMPKPPRYISSNWQPKFQDNSIDLVINAHEHLYERLYKNGVNYLVTGSAAATPGYKKPFTNKYSVFKKRGIRTVSVLQVDKSGSIHLETYNTATRKLIDSHTY